MMLSLALTASPASAFTEQQVVVPQGQPQTEAQKPAAPGLPPVALTDPNTAAPKTEGTNVTIPGLGSVGVLPKLDFGLELLYGPQDGAERAPIEPQANDGDLQIKGTIKHRF